MPLTAVVDPVTNMFCTDGMLPGRIVVVVSANPNPRLQRYSGDPVNPLRDATAQEISDFDAAAADAAAAAVFDTNKLFRAKCISDLAFRLGVAPGALTPTQIATERARIIAIYKTLP